MKEEVSVTATLRQALGMLGLLTLLTGVVYPLVMTGLARLTMSSRADGNPMVLAGQLVGSELVGQSFDDPQHFWGRPSATEPVPYRADASSGSNLSPFGKAFHEQAAARTDALRKADPGNNTPVPIDLVTASASGLDPHISPQAAYYQASRVAHARAISVDRVRQLVDDHLERPTWGFLGQPRVNVLMLNLALEQELLDRPKPSRGAQ
ncbi:MAG: potassium-transporting ATPase subunit KdpC [Acidobacteria bacterium]|nr:potassium-transporting ATPase subunit KdpC [Acidobacteriota bacterium]